MRRTFSLHHALVLGLTVLALSGCKVNADDVEEWKGTIKGPAKIVAVMLSDKYPVELRARAGLALVEMDRGDVDGVVELPRTLRDERMDAATRAQIIALLSAEKGGLRDLMIGGDTAQNAAAADEAAAAGPSELQGRAKDAAYLLIPLAEGDSKQRLNDMVMDWYAEDFNGRNLAGSYSAEQVIRALGSPAAGRLVTALNARLPSAALTKLSELVAAIGDTATKKKAAERLVAIEREMESAAFVDWLKGKVREQAAATGGKKLDEKRITTAAEYNRENYVLGALSAMKHLASEEVVVTRLLEIASAKSDALTQRRIASLQALEGKVKEKHLDTLMGLALDESNPVQVRDYAFDRVGDVGSKKAIPSLWSLVGGASEDEGSLRWRAGELVLAIGGEDVLGAFFAKLPGNAAFEPKELNGYATRIGDMQGTAARKLMQSKLSSGQWWERILALRYFEKKGTKADVGSMKALSNDGAAVSGKDWKNFEIKTVGDAAKEAVKAINARLGAGG